VAVIAAPIRTTDRTTHWRLYGSLLVSAAFLATNLISHSPLIHYGSYGLLAAAGLCWALWVYSAAQLRARRAVSSRLTRLPDDFMLLNDLVIAAPWGQTRLDQIILSRFGIVVVSTGPPRRWLVEQVEAVRSLLFGRGLLHSGLPVGSLILLPPGATSPVGTSDGAPIIPVEHLRLEHLAPSRTPVLTQAQMRAIAHCLLHSQKK
jgi:hypothetical protein